MIPSDNEETTETSERKVRPRDEEEMRRYPYHSPRPASWHPSMGPPMEPDPRARH